MTNLAEPLKRKASGQLLEGEPERAKDMIVARLEEAARKGEVAPSSDILRKEIGLGEKAIDRFLNQLCAAKRISWKTLQGGEHGQFRVVTVHASGLTTAIPAPPPPKKKHHGRFFVKTAKSELTGISDGRLYGPIEYAVKVLRRRGFVVFKDGAGVRVGAKLMQPWQVEQIAAREIRLAGLA